MPLTFTFTATMKIISNKSWKDHAGKLSSLCLSVWCQGEEMVSFLNYLLKFSIKHVMVIRSQRWCNIDDNAIKKGVLFSVEWYICTLFDIIIFCSDLTKLTYHVYFLFSPSTICLKASETPTSWLCNTRGVRRHIPKLKCIPTFIYFENKYILHKVWTADLYLILLIYKLNQKASVCFVSDKDRMQIFYNLENDDDDDDQTKSLCK